MIDTATTPRLAAIQRRRILFFDLILSVERGARQAGQPPVSWPELRELYAATGRMLSR